MTARTDTDPVPAASVAGTGSRRPRVAVVLVAAIVLTALVQAFVLQSYVVPSARLPGSVEPGDRLVLWKLASTPAAGDLVVVDTTATAAHDRASPVDDGLLGRTLSRIARFLGVEVDAQDRLAVVAGVAGNEVELGEPVPQRLSTDDLVGTAVLRVWPLDRLGAVTGAS